MLRESGHEHLRGSLVVPLFDAGGAVVDLYGRKIRDDLRPGTPSHLYLPGPHRGVFNLAAFPASEEIILTEALIDAMTFWCAGYRNVTSAYGAGGLTDEIVAALTQHNIRRVLIAYDRDAAGDKGAAAVAESLAPLGIGVYRILFPKGMDANAYVLNVGPPAKSLGALLRAAEWMAGVENRPRISIPEAPAITPADAYLPPNLVPLLSQPPGAKRLCPLPNPILPKRPRNPRMRDRSRPRHRPRSWPRRGSATSSLRWARVRPRVSGGYEVWRATVPPMR